jgi:quercetin dioxygenase-like cupin family protein
VSIFPTSNTAREKGNVPSFTCYALGQGPLADLSDDPFPTTVSAWREAGLALEATGTHFGFVYSGQAILRCPSGTFVLQPGMYFAVPGTLNVCEGAGLIVSRLGYRGLFHLGGPVEDRGRLRYIDGCTDSLLIPPVVRGDPCLNLLHLPPHTRQTPHSHPSVRVGLVLRGEGLCLADGQQIPLAAGRAFVIRADGLHCFHTDGSELLVLAYHPDSDFGPTDEDHPMVNRTVVPRR